MYPWNEILRLCDEIEALLTDALPGANDAKLTRIRALAVRLGGHDPYINTKAARIADRAGYFFSARRHQQLGGPDALMHEMRYTCLSAIREQARYRRDGQA